MPEWCLCLTYSYSKILYKAYHSLLVHENTRQKFSTMLGAIWNSEMTNKLHKNVENMAQNRLQKGDLFTV